jgi:uncharacterized protein
MKEIIRLIVKENGEYSDPIIIRAHHLLCMQGFQGYGYNKDFERHMGKIITFLKSIPSTKIQIVTKTDEICSQCPYKYKSSCNRDQNSHFRIEKLDSFVIKKALLKENHVYQIFEALRLVNNNIDQDSLIEICDQCGWKNKCLFFKKKLNFDKP